MVTTYRISQLASRTGTTPATLRFYDQEGLLPAGRSAAGYRVYGDDAVERLEFIAEAKRLGLPLGEIRELLAAWDEAECASLRDRLRPLLAARIAGAARQAADATALTGQLTAVLSRLAAPPVAGRCEPGCCLTGRDVAAASAPVPHAGDREPLVPVPGLCLLPADSQGRRLAEWRELSAQARRREPIDSGVRLGLPISVAGQAAALAAAEVQCCPFFTFTLHLAHDEALLDVRVPADLVPGLSAMLAGGAAPA